MIGVAGADIVLVGLVIAVVLLVAYRETRRGRTAEDLIFTLLVVVGAVFAPQLMTVVLLAMILQELRASRRARSSSPPA